MSVNSIPFHGPIYDATSPGEIMMINLDLWQYFFCVMGRVTKPVDHKKT